MKPNFYNTDLDRNSANYQALTPLTFLERAASVFPDHIAIVHGQLRRKYATFYSRSRQLASALTQMGIGRGDTVSVLLANTPAMLECHYGVPMCGGVLHSINTRLDAAVMAFQLDHAMSCVVIVDREFMPLMQQALTLATVKPIVIQYDDPEFDLPKAKVDVKDYDALLAEGDSNFVWLMPEDEWDAISINYTSGTTGDPKGVVLSIENVGSNVRAISDLLHLSPADTALGVLPFFHSYGYTTALWVPLTLEPAVVYHTNPLDAKVVGTLARDYHATVLMATPTFLRTYIRRTESDDLSTLEVVFGAAEKLTTDVTDAFEEKFGVRPREAYGATELSPLVSANVPPSRHVPGRAIDAREGTVGKPILGCKAKITDREGLHELPALQT